jgi:uncharacterized SAM-binding protein YcdF (DUF218 family)
MSGYRIITSQVSGGATRTFVRDVLPRGLALFFGLFGLLNLLGNLRVAGFDMNLWWIDLRWAPAWAAWIFLLVTAMCLISFGLKPVAANWRRRLTLICVVLVALISFANSLAFLILLARRMIVSSMPLPLSLLVTASMILIGRAVWRSPGFGTKTHSINDVARPFSLSSILSRRSLGSTKADRGEGWGEEVRSSQGPPGKLWPALAVCACCAFVFPLAEMLCFGKTDYRRPADVAVVLGCRVYADGRPSDALKDRVKTACQLYRQGFARTLLFSGGPGDGSVTEAEAMRRMAVQLGVKAEDILVDDQGLNTQATVRNSQAILAKLNASRVLVVSHFYHLPRVKLAFQRAGREVFTVPAKESYLLRQMPYNMAREVAALWVYYVRPLGAA